MTNAQKEWINSVKKIDDIKEYYETGKYTYNFDGRESYLQSIKESDGITIIPFNNDVNTMVFDIDIFTFGIVEETKVPSGYEKETFVVPMVLRLYSSNDKFKVIDFTPISFESYISGSCGKIYYNSFLLKYSKTINYNNFYEVINSMDDSYVLNNSCNIPFTLGDIYGYNMIDHEYEKNGLCNFIIANKKGNPNITIRGSLNNEDSLMINEDSKVNYKLIIKNESNTPSNNNKIKSIIPSGVEYVENSATNNGEYNKSDNSINWDIEYIDSEEEILLSYDVNVKNTKDNTYKFLTSLKNEENNNIQPVSNIIKTENTIINPKTGYINIYYYVIFLIVIGIVTFLIVDKKKINKL